MAIGTTNVSVKGDLNLRKALKAVAAARGITVGELVREAIDSQFGQDIEKHISFFTSIETKKSQLNTN